MIETSRSFAKDLMLKHGIPTPRGGICSTYEEAFHFCFTHLDEEARLIDGSRIAIKGDGQDALFPQTQQEAIQMFGQFWRFPSSSESGEKNQVVYEELVRGNEISVLSFSDGRKDYVRLPYAQSQKGAYEGDLGAKTKGMGCIAPVSFDSVIEENIEKIIEKTLLALKLQSKQIPSILDELEY
jgi:phosphoribosylamine-glycine ligase